MDCFRSFSRSRLVAWLSDRVRPARGHLWTYRAKVNHRWAQRDVIESYGFKDDRRFHPNLLRAWAATAVAVGVSMLMGNVPQPGIIANSAGAFGQTSQSPQEVNQQTLAPVGGGGGGGGGVYVPNATGNATTDTANIQSSINSLAAIGGGILYFGTGTWWINASLTIPALNSNQTAPIIFSGAGYMEDGDFTTAPFGTILLAKSLAANMVLGSSTHFNQLGFEKMTIIGNSVGYGGTQSAGSLLYLNNTLECVIRDVELLGGYADNITFDTGTPPGGGSNDICTIDHVRSERARAYGINFNSIMVQGSMTNCHFERNFENVFTAATCAQMSFVGNSFESATQRGLEINGSQHMFANNWVGESGYEGLILYGSECTLIGNTFVSNGSTGTDPIGLRLYNATKNTVMANVSTDGNGNQLYGFSEEGTSDYNMVMGNNFTGNVTRGVEGTVGAHTCLFNNQGAVTSSIVNADGTVFATFQRVTGAMQMQIYGQSTFPAILGLIAPNGTDYADFTYDGSNADVDVSVGDLNLRPNNVAGNHVNIWSLNGQPSLRVGNQGFTHALSLSHDGTNAHIAPDTGFIGFQASDIVQILADGVIMPVRAATGSAPAYVKGGVYFDTTLNKLRIGGASAWETVTSA